MTTRFLLPVALAACMFFTACDDGPAAPADTAPTAEAIAAMKGGNPMPEGAAKVTFPFMGKQSLMCVGDSYERQIAFVDFGAEGAPKVLGNGEIKADGSATATFTLPANLLRTGHALRDKKLLQPEWLDAGNFPNLVLEVTSMTKVADTVYDVKGTWTMRDVTKPVRFLANVRYIPEMPRVGEHVIRVKGGFDVDLKEYECSSAAIGSLACAQVWNVDVVLLGVMQKGE